MAKRKKRQQYGSRRRATPERLKVVFDHLRKGWSIRAACGEAGIHRNTLFVARKADPKIQEQFEIAEDKGYACVVRKLYQQIQKGNLKAILFALERKWHADWGRRDADAVTPERLMGVFSQLALLLMAKIPAESHPAVSEAIAEAIKSMEGGKEDDASAA